MLETIFLETEKRLLTSDSARNWGLYFLFVCLFVFSVLKFHDADEG